MIKTHQDLEAMLAELDTAIPALLGKYPEPDAFWSAFNGLVDEIMEDAGMVDESAGHEDGSEQAWACAQLDKIMCRHHLMPPADQI
jgi:hypothetical protein